LSAAALRPLGSMLGTTVYALDRPIERAAILSDLHVPDDGGPTFGALQAAIAAAVARRADLFLLGDVFDSYSSPAQVHVGIWRDTAAELRAAARQGLAVFVLHGNRDFLLGDEFAAAAEATVVPGALQVDLAGAPTVLAHGDEFCVNDLPYLRAKRLLRGRFTRFLSDHLPLRAAMAIAARARKRSKTTVMVGDQTRFLPTANAVSTAFAFGARRVVFGHIHRHARGSLAGGDYRVLPAFDATGVGLWAEPGELRPVHFGPGGVVEGVAEPGPCPFGPERG
jgi:UDP-2,3-diacylglucosamine hydrolase